MKIPGLFWGQFRRDGALALRQLVHPLVVVALVLGEDACDGGDVTAGDVLQLLAVDVLDVGHGLDIGGLARRDGDGVGQLRLPRLGAATLRALRRVRASTRDPASVPRVGC